MNIQENTHVPRISHPLNQNRNKPSEAFFSGIILKSRPLNAPHSLQTKTVIKKSPENVADTFISSLFPSNASEGTLITLEVSLRRCQSAIEKAPHDISLQIAYIQELLRTAYSSKLTKRFMLEEAYMKHAQTLMERVKKTAYFHPEVQFTSYLFRVYQGLKCVDIYEIQGCLLTLRKAIELDPNNLKLLLELNQIISFLEIGWERLYKSGKLDEKNYSLFKERLLAIRSADPFKNTLIQRPSLFKLVENAPKEFLKRHPHLISPNHFLAAYPEVGDCQLKQHIYNLNHLRLCLEQAKISPLTRRILLISDKPLLSPSAIDMIKETLIDHPHLQVLLGNEIDGENLAKRFSDDPMLVPNKGYLKCKVHHLETLVYSYSIDPNHLFIRKSTLTLLSNPARLNPPTPNLETKIDSLPTPIQNEVKSSSALPVIIISAPTKQAVVKTETKTFIPLSLSIPLSSTRSSEQLNELHAIISQKQSLISSSGFIERARYHGECAHYQLAKALIHRTCKRFEKEKQSRDQAEKSTQLALDSDCLSPLAHYASYLLKAYPSIDCLDIDLIQDCLLTLKKASRRKELEETATFFKNSWVELKDKGCINEEDYQFFNKSLSKTLNKDPYKEDFIKDPSLFLHTQKRSFQCLLGDTLLDEYPHLASPEAFLAKYPRVGYVFLNGAYNQQNLEDAIKRVDHFHLARNLLLVSATPILDDKGAELLREFLLKKLGEGKFGLIIGNKKDENLLRKALGYDPYIVCKPLNVTNYPEAVHFSINIDLLG